MKVFERVLFFKMNTQLPNLSSRQKTILEVIIHEFIKTGEPVSSNTITDKYGINYSSATVRNEMAVLEDLGFLKQLHTASGRVPEDSAYRMFVNDIIRNKIAPPPRETADTIEKEYNKIKLHLELLLEKTASLLSDLTNYTSMLLAPQLRKSLFKYLRLVSVSPTTVMLFMLSTTGAILHKTIEFSKPTSPEELERLTYLLNNRLSGKPLEELEYIINETQREDPQYELISSIGRESESLLEAEQEVILKGTSRILNISESKDVNNIKLMLELLEEEKIIAEILSKTIQLGDINISIGSENQLDEMKGCTLITAAYKFKGKPVGTLGIIGSRRMPYKEIISIINYTAENFSNKLDTFDSI